MLNPPLPSNLMTAWKVSGLLLTAIGVLLGYGFADTWQSMFKVWMESETYGHGAVVAPISAWLLWWDRQRWLRQEPQISWSGLPLVLAGSIGWLVAELAGVNVVAQYSLLLLLWGMAWTVLGWAVIQPMAFALGFLFFMVPAGDSLNTPLMEATATATISALRAVGLPVYREGMLFTLPTGQWSVVEACSGLRYVLAAAMLGALFSWMNFRSWRLRIAFFVSAILLALVGNWARAWLVVMIGHLSEMRYGTGDDHVWYGWVFFGLVMGGLFWMGGRFQERVADTQQAQGAITRSPTVSKVSASVEPSAASIGRATSAVSRAFAMLVGLAVAAGVVAYAQEAAKVTPRPTIPGFERLTTSSSGTSREQAAYTWQGARSQIDRRIELAEAEHRSSVIVHGAYFADQDAGYEMISPDNLIRARRLPGWSSVGVRSLTPQTAAAQPSLSTARVQEHLLARGEERRLMWVWYEIDGHRLDSDLRAKAWTAWSMLAGRGDHSCVWVILTDIDGSITNPQTPSAETAARDRLSEQFLRTSCD